ncbi:MAG: hypothetical protein BWY35_01220 [Firmicutes bacterium ADurb.Bin248]|nr:MAG: hypothetical protein BWY35_01220 [Firmicutes bacterium ADurb.Bin248]HOF99763.1 hypothetical protein [Clostridia bacterium]HPK14695.1 hypothetical protein [Clostridia bacterium]
MEICRMERAARPGWSEAEETLLFERAKKAREHGQPLKSVFDEVAMQTGRKPNSIRNYYYARVKEGACEGAAFHSAAFVPFTEEEVRALMREVLSAQARGMSVRACTLNMGEGDTRKMLRYQNKYRALVKSDPALVREIILELEAEGTPAFDPYRDKEVRAQTAQRFDRREAAAFFEALEALAAKYRRMIM